MKADPEQRAVQLGEYIAAHNATVRFLKGRANNSARPSAIKAST